MELLSVIRRWRHRDDFSIREISRRSGLSRNTVRKYLRADSVEPQFTAPDRPSKLDPYADKLSAMLRVEMGKSRKQKRTIKQLHADLAVLGYGGSYNRVAAFARDWKAGAGLPPSGGSPFSMTETVMDSRRRRARRRASRTINSMSAPVARSMRASGTRCRASGKTAPRLGSGPACGRSVGRGDRNARGLSKIPRDAPRLDRVRDGAGSRIGSLDWNRAVPHPEMGQFTRERVARADLLTLLVGTAGPMQASPAGDGCPPPRRGRSRPAAPRPPPRANSCRTSEEPICV